MSQAAGTFWDERVGSVGAASIPAAHVPTRVRVKPLARRRARTHRLVDATVLMIILAAAATCASVYSRARAELSGALTKHEAAGEKVRDLRIKVETLERDVQQLRTDSRAIELLARQKYGYVRSGDVVIKLAQAQTDSATRTVTETSARASNLTPRPSDGYTDASN